MYHDPVATYRQYRRRTATTAAPLTLPPEFHHHHHHGHEEREHGHTRTQRSNDHTWTTAALIMLFAVLAVFVAVLVWIFGTDDGVTATTLLHAGYFLHIPGVDPTLGEPFATRQSAALAQRGRPDKPIISFVLSEDEREHWREREYMRFSSGEYIDLPWTYRGRVRVNSSGVAVWRYPTEDEQTTLGDHYAHLSIKHPGLIAYTPSDEHGHSDRQITIKPGRYLEQFYGEIFSKENRDRLVAEIKALTGDLRIARSTADVIRVYRNGPDSCMSHGNDSYETNDIHPVSVYGESDLGVAYLGELDDVRARCIVWPERKLYGRLYGDDALTALLRNNGYTHRSTFGGARVRVIRVDGSRGRYVMPYIDAAESVDLVRDSDAKGTSWFVLNDDDDGEYCCKDTDGVTYKLEKPIYCARCGDNRVENDGDKCSDCDDLISCDSCDRSMSSDDGYGHGDSTLCERCYNRLPTCEASNCYEKIDDGESFCSSCEDDWRHCVDCGDAFDTGDLESDHDTERCLDCQPEPEEDDDEDDHEYQAVPVVMPTIRINVDGGRDHRVVAVDRQSRMFALHLSQYTGSNPDRWVVTHKRTGLVAYHANNHEDGTRAFLILASSESSVNWDMTDTNGITSEHYAVINRVRDGEVFNPRIDQIVASSASCFPYEVSANV